ncbi:hypothetical protein BDV95DRAFT_597515 [Massariosphaeria phaeospora]|uniref:Uncharacterized protein n=1 Tax=Massariosphaeria phaeospora TaxID=100035 RepID=A0A7C8MFL0_9PLEO|nr:hypothetical protein BDV95DRAFT_597515 [Massariosphaeria phaeospora]
MAKTTNKKKSTLFSSTTGYVLGTGKVVKPRYKPKQDGDNEYELGVGDSRDDGEEEGDGEEEEDGGAKRGKRRKTRATKELQDKIDRNRVKSRLVFEAIVARAETNARNSKTPTEDSTADPDEAPDNQDVANDPQDEPCLIGKPDKHSSKADGEDKGEDDLNYDTGAKAGQAGEEARRRGAAERKRGREDEAETETGMRTVRKRAKVLRSGRIVHEGYRLDEG